MRTLVIIIVLALIVMIAKRLLQRPQRPQTPVKRHQKNEHMVQCASCGTYIPEQEAIQRAGRYYCSQTHLDEDLH